MTEPRSVLLKESGSDPRAVCTELELREEPKKVPRKEVMMSTNVTKRGASFFAAPGAEDVPTPEYASRESEKIKRSDDWCELKGMQRKST